MCRKGYARSAELLGVHNDVRSREARVVEENGAGAGLGVVAGRRRVHVHGRVCPVEPKVERQRKRLHLRRGAGKEGKGVKHMGACLLCACASVEERATFYYYYRSTVG